VYDAKDLQSAVANQEQTCHSSSSNKEPPPEGNAIEIDHGGPQREYLQQQQGNDNNAGAVNYTGATSAQNVPDTSVDITDDSLDRVSSDVAQLAVQLRGMLSVVESLDSRLQTLQQAALPSSSNHS
jgi:hypothetical protein